MAAPLTWATCAYVSLLSYGYTYYPQKYMTSLAAKDYQNRLPSQAIPSPFDLSCLQLCLLTFNDGYIFPQKYYRCHSHDLLKRKFLALQANGAKEHMTNQKANKICCTMDPTVLISLPICLLGVFISTPSHNAQHISTIWLVLHSKLHRFSTSSRHTIILASLPSFLLGVTNS